MQLKVPYFVTLCLLLIAIEGHSNTFAKQQSNPKVIPRSRCLTVLKELPNLVPRGCELPRYRYKRPRPFCVRLKESKLLEKLKNVGGFNPRYMAVNRDQASKFIDFIDLTIDLGPQDRSLNLQNKTIKYVTTKEKPSRRQKRMVSSGPDTVLRGCLSAGTFFENTTFKHTCTECSATTQLAANIFPPFINEVVCHETDRLCSPTIGRCFQRALKFTFLQSTGNFARNDGLSASFGGDVFEEEWKEFDQDVRSCCDCRAF